MADRLTGRAVVAAVGSDHHRSRWGLALATKGPLVGKHDMHSRRLDGPHHLDGSRQFPLQRPETGDVLHEGGEAEGAQLVEEFVADSPAARQPLFGENHARSRGLSRGRQDDCAFRVDVERHARLAKRRADGGDVVAIEPGIKRLHGRAAEVVAGEPGHREDRGPDQRERSETADAQPLQVRPEAFRLRQKVRRHSRVREDCIRMVTTGACAGIALDRSESGLPGAINPPLAGSS